MTPESRIAAALRSSDGKRSVTARREDVVWLQDECRRARAAADMYERAFNVAMSQVKEAQVGWSRALDGRVSFWPAWCWAVALSAAAGFGGYAVGAG